MLSPLLPFIEPRMWKVKLRTGEELFFTYIERLKPVSKDISDAWYALEKSAFFEQMDMASGNQQGKTTLGETFERLVGEFELEQPRVAKTPGYNKLIGLMRALIETHHWHHDLFAEAQNIMQNANGQLKFIDHASIGPW